MRLLLGLTLTCLCLCTAPGIGAQDGVPAPLDVTDQAAPVFTVFGAQEGLSDEIWSTVGFDAHGFVWAGSASSLARFDGYRWTPWSFAGAGSLVRDMLTDDDGVLWALFEREGLARYDGRSWSVQRDVEGFLQRFSTTTSVDGTRSFWISQDLGFSRLQAGRWLPDPGNAAVTSGRAIAIEQTETLFGAPRQWMASASDGLWYRRLQPPAAPGPWQRFEPPELARTLSTDLLRNFNRGVEELWVVTYGSGLVRIRNDGIWIWRAETGEIPSEAMYSALVTHTPQGDSLLWFASRAGLVQVRGDTITVFDRRHGLPSDAIRGLKVQRDVDGIDLLWLATEGGVVRAALTRSQWQTVSLMGARENGIFSLLLEPDGQGGERLWVGTAKHGIGLLQHDTWRYFSRQEGTLPSEGVRSAWRIPGIDGSMWRLLALTGGELLRVDDALQFSTLTTPWPKHSDAAATTVLARQHEGTRELWFGTLHDGVFRLRGDTWTAYPGSANLPWSVTGITEQVDASGRSWLWAASSAGLHRFDGDHWAAPPASLGLPADGFRSTTLIKEGGRDVLWASSNRHGVIRIDVTDPAALQLLTDDRIPPPPDPTVYSILRDSHGLIYICTNNGVQQLTPRPDGSYDERVFRRRDGLVHDECNTNAQFIDAQDRYWVGTLGGLSVFDPSIRAATQPTQSKPLYITDVRIDSRSQPLAPDAALELPAGTRELRIDFTLLSGIRETESSYRTQLLGFDPEPSAWTAEHSRNFSNLPPGDYEFVIEARDYAGTLATPHALRIRAQPFWWQRAWVIPSTILLLLLAGIGLVTLYNRNLRRRQRQLTREVASRTAELNTANLRLTELSYVDPLTGVANRRRLMEAIDDAIDRAAEMSLPIGLIVIDVDHFKHYNDRHGHLAGDAALRAVAKALQSATREQDLVARFGGEEFACLLIDAGIEVVERIAERMRALVEALPPRALGNNVDTVTMSAGFLSRLPAPGERAADLLRDADVALYRAKHEGRNRVRQARS